MLSDAQQQLGHDRLEEVEPGTRKLKSGDQRDLLSAFRTWLGVASTSYADLPEKLAAAENEVAAKLAGVLLLLKGMGFSTSKMEGGRFGIVSDKNDRRALMLRFALGLLYDVVDETLGAEDDCPTTGSFSFETGTTF